jgi:hypothetical protein
MVCSLQTFFAKFGLVRYVGWGTGLRLVVSVGLLPGCYRAATSAVQFGRFAFGRRLIFLPFHVKGATSRVPTPTLGNVALLASMPQQQQCQYLEVCAREGKPLRVPKSKK